MCSFAGGSVSKVGMSCSWRWIWMRTFVVLQVSCRVTRWKHTFATVRQRMNLGWVGPAKYGAWKSWGDMLGLNVSFSSWLLWPPFYLLSCFIFQSMLILVIKALDRIIVCFNAPRRSSQSLGSYYNTQNVDLRENSVTIIFSP